MELYGQMGYGFPPHPQRRHQPHPQAEYVESKMEPAQAAHRQRFVKPLPMQSNGWLTASANDL